MRIIKEKKYNLVMAEVGYHIRAVNDEYIPEHEEDGQIIPEYFPYYSEMIYVPTSMTEEQIKKLYIEEEKENA